ncbi:MAG: archaellin/type IV pilin N-terminal domain-containing protein [Candidatus Bathyarchaeia archaeon]|jgi:flagellin-like protein
MNLKDTKALSPIIASIILIAITTTVAIAGTTWMGSITFGFMDQEGQKQIQSLVVPPVDNPAGTDDEPIATPTATPSPTASPSPTPTPTTTPTPTPSLTPSPTILPKPTDFAESTKLPDSTIKPKPPPPASPFM